MSSDEDRLVTHGEGYFSADVDEMLLEMNEEW